jgi:hypothetical protein
MKMMTVRQAMFKDKFNHKVKKLASAFFRLDDKNEQNFFK